MKNGAQCRKNKRVGSFSKSITIQLKHTQGGDPIALFFYLITIELQPASVGDEGGAVLHLAHLAEKGVGLVEKEDGIRSLGCSEYPVEVFFGLTDEFACNSKQIDAHEVFSTLVSDYLSGDSLAGATLTGKKTNNAPARLVISTDIPEPGYGVLGAGQMLSRSGCILGDGVEFPHLFSV